MCRQFLSITTLIVSLSLLISFPSLADWEKNTTGWWYQEYNGSYPINSWKEIGNKWYYFNQDGYMLSNTVTPDGYRVGTDGAWIQGNSYIYENKKSEIQNLANNFGEVCEFIVQDLNADGIEELIAFIGLPNTRTISAWTYSNGNIKELNVPDCELPAIWLEKDVLCFASVGHSSHETYHFYKLNSNYEFEFITGVTWENGAYNGLGHDTFYIDDKDLKHIQEINKNEYEDILSSY